MLIRRLQQREAAPDRQHGVPRLIAGGFKSRGPTLARERFKENNRKNKSRHVWRLRCSQTNAMAGITLNAE